MFPTYEKERPSKHTEALIVTENQVYLEECTNERTVKCAFWNRVLLMYIMYIYLYSTYLCVQHEG